MDVFSTIITKTASTRALQPDEIECLNKVLLALMDINQLLSANLKDWLREPIKLYLLMLRELKHSATPQIEELAKKCQLIALEFDYYNLDTILNVFKNK